MQYVNFGTTGLQISRLGFGGIPIQRIDQPGTRELLIAVPSAAYGGCTPTRACGRSPAGEAFYSPSTASITRSQSSKDRFVEQGRLTIYLR